MALRLLWVQGATSVAALIASQPQSINDFAAKHNVPTVSEAATGPTAAVGKLIHDDFWRSHHNVKMCNVSTSSGTASATIAISDGAFDDSHGDDNTWVECR